jgi:hypothetical protein
MGSVIEPAGGCASWQSFDRRRFLGRTLAGLGVAGMSWLTPVGHLLAAQAERRREPARSIIMIWLAGGPSQLETFDPHPGTMIAGGTRAIATAVKGVQLAEGFGRLAEVMGDVTLIRSMVGKEGDHERGTYLMKTRLPDRRPGEADSRRHAARAARPRQRPRS